MVCGVWQRMQSSTVVREPRGHAAMDVLMEEIEAAKREGRLALPEPHSAADGDGDAEDAEFVEVAERDDEPDGAN